MASTSEEAIVQSPTSGEQRIGLLPSHANPPSADVQLPSESDKPPLLKHTSSPAYNSPLRHHQRHTSSHRHVKESLNAHSEYITSEDDGAAQHRINQYIIKQEIGRGSFGAVHLAVDQYGHEYAVKEFSKARLRKRAQSHLLRRPKSQRKRPQVAAGKQGFNSPLHRREPSDHPDDNDKLQSSIDLIKEEIAVMKKLDHPNLVSLIEVLDDPTEDSLYMVMEMCKKGVVMKVGLDEKADPYPEEKCRCWFRDLLLGIEYLHAQGIVHRDIKPDNCLITDEDVLKVVDFGVSEMFEKHSEMLTAKSAGSPAFLPPELCVVKHGDISGKAADIWSMGVTLYCLKYGRIPFERAGIFDLYEAIRQELPALDGESDKSFQDLISKMLEKNPAKRIKMADLREHPWVTENGTDPLLSEEENTAGYIEPTEADMDNAITGNMPNLITVLKAVRKFKGLLSHQSLPIMSSILGEEGISRFSQPPLALQRGMPAPPHLEHKSRSIETFDRRAIEGALAAEGVHREIDLSSQGAGQVTAKRKQFDGGIDPIREDSAEHAGEERRPNTIRTPPMLSTEHSEESPDALSRRSTAIDTPTDDPEKFPPFERIHAHTSDDTGHRGHAHDPLEDQLYLFVGPSTFAGPSGNADRRPSFVPDDDDVPIVSESPGAADIDIYETAYRDEIERIRSRARVEETEPTVYLTRRVDARLMRLSGHAGRLMARGEESFEKFNEATNFRERRAKVTEVSRALKAAAKEEYSKKRQERKRELEAAKSGSVAAKGGQPAPPQLPPRNSATSEGDTTAGELPIGEGTERPWRPGTFRNPFGGKSSETGKRTKDSFLGLMSAMKEKAKSSRSDSAGT